MQIKRPANERGYAEHGWLRSFHSFSFADYFDRNYMHFGPLRVINEDWVAAGTGFGMHPHKDMEIVTYILEGELTHQDSMGHQEVIRPNDVQRMSAGTGVYHSEFNRHPNKTCHLLQIWIMPDQKDLKPAYEQTAFDPAEKRGKLRLIAAPDGAEGAVTIHSNTRLYSSISGAMTSGSGDNKDSSGCPSNSSSTLSPRVFIVSVNIRPGRPACPVCGFRNAA